MLDNGKRPLTQASSARIDRGLCRVHNLGQSAVFILASADSDRAGLERYTMRRVVGHGPLFRRLGDNPICGHIGEQARNLARLEGQAVRVGHVVALGKLSSGELGMLILENFEQQFLDFGVSERLGAGLCVLLGADTLLDHFGENGGHVGMGLCERFGGDGEGLNLGHAVLLAGHGLTLPLCPLGRWWGLACPCPLSFSILGVRVWFVKCHGVSP